MRIGLDVDDVLTPCTDIILQKLHEMGYEFEDADISWDFSSYGPEIQNAAHELIQEGFFFSRQEPMDGAREMIQALLDRGHEVFFVSAVSPNHMSIRGKQLMEWFPMVPQKNIILGSRKDLVKLDILLDDAPHNIRQSAARYPVLFLRKYNQHMKPNHLSVVNYPNFLKLVDFLDGMKGKLNKTKLVCLVGPSASGKTTIADELIGSGLFVTARSTTTRPIRPEEPEDSYEFVTEELFRQYVANGDFVEHVQYGVYQYGLRKPVIDAALATGKPVVLVMDIGGANAIKHIYGEEAQRIFILRDKRDILTALLERDVPIADKVSRIMTMDVEYANESQCDRTVHNRDIHETVKQIMDIVKE